MLCHHEIATLILVEGAQDLREFDRADLDTYWCTNSWRWKKRPAGQACPRISHRGHSILKAVGLRH